MTQQSSDFMKSSQAPLDLMMTFASDWTKGLQSIAVEMTDYSKRILEQNTAVFEKLAAVRSLEQALDVQATFTKTAYEDFVQQSSRINAIMADLTKQAMKPMESGFSRKF